MVNTNGEETTMPDSFIANAYESGDSLVITIPANIVKFTGIRKGDLLKTWIKKTQQK